MSRIAIVGLGLIGGSVGLALKRAGLADIEIVGYDKDQENAGRAKRRGAIDRAAWNLPGAVEGASLVILAVPVLALRPLFEAMAPHLAPGAIVHDTASTKEQALAWADAFLPSEASYVGGHPMAGKEQAGIDAADPDLFRAATYCLAPSLKAAEGAVDYVAQLVVSVLGAKPFFIDPVEHDGYVAAVSHLPLVAAAALVSSTSGAPTWPEMSRLAANGYQDTTRLASGDPEMANDICATNQVSLDRWLSQYIAELERWRVLIRDGGPPLRAAFEQAQAARDRWQAQRAQGILATEPPAPEMPKKSQAFRQMFGGEWLSKRLRRRPGVEPAAEAEERPR